MVAVAWKDNKVVNVASTLAAPNDTTHVNRTQKDGTHVAVPCPQSVALYNKYMGGVDNGDQLRGSYRVRLKCRKNYKYVFGFHFDVTITNCYILSSYNARSDSQMDHKRFRITLAEQLIGNYNSRKRAGRPRKCPHPSNTATTPQMHLPSHTSSKRCVYCNKRRQPPRRKETVWYCAACDGHPSLCRTGRDNGSDCFRLWHQL